MDDDLELDEAAERIRARFEAEGTSLPLEYIRDVVYQYEAMAAQHPAIAMPLRGDNAVKRVAAALLEDEAVIQRIVEALARDQEAHPPVVPVPMANLPATTETAAPEAVRIAARLKDAGFPVTTDLVDRVMARLLAALITGAEPLAGRAARTAVARRIASELGEHQTLVRRIVAEVVLVLGDRSRANPITDGPPSAGLADGAAAIAARMRGYGLRVTPDDVFAVVRELLRLTGDGIAPDDPVRRQATVEQVAGATGRPVSLVSAIFDEMARDEVLSPTRQVTSAEPRSPQVRRRKRPPLRA